MLTERVPEDEQRLHRILSRFRGNGLLGTSGNQELWVGTYRRPGEKAELRAELLARGEIVPIEVEGLKGQRFVVPHELPILEAVRSAELAGEDVNNAARQAAPDLDDQVYAQAIYSLGQDRYLEIVAQGSGAGRLIVVVRPRAVSATVYSPGGTYGARGGP